ncbi:MAG: pyridine nucleotide-disulfide oxidoreductase, partial [Bryobacteraceae bacterium]
MPISSGQLDLRFGLAFEDLYCREGLVRLDAAFIEYLRAADAPLCQRLLDAQKSTEGLTRKRQSELILAVAPHLEHFIGELFGIRAELRALQTRHDELAALQALKRKFVQKKAISGVSQAQASAFNGPALRAELETLFNEPLTEASFVQHVSRWLDAETEHKPELQTAAQYAAWAALSPAGMEQHHRGVLFKVPHKLEMSHLIQVETREAGGILEIEAPARELRHREGFKLTDPGMGLAAAADQAHYCIKCHNQGKDSCSTGLKEKDGSFKKSVFGVTLAGCPLEEKISEMNLMTERGHSVGAVAITVIDNPMAAGTGHRICNDCMKSCIFQKQEPVDIPQVETRSLKDVLELPWGFEIYSLLTRWNPLNFERPMPRPASGYKVLVVGLGPAGFTLAHHLMNDGHTVAG